MNSTITIVGNVTRTPALRFTASGVPTANFGVAVNRKLPPRADGSTAEAVSFFNVVAWQSLAENAAESLDKGNRVVVTGRLEQRSWETADGDRRTVYELVADEIGPSLRWVSARLTKVVRVDRRTGTSSPGTDGAPGTDGEAGDAHDVGDSDLHVDSSSFDGRDDGAPVRQHGESEEQHSGLSMSGGRVAKDGGEPF